MYTTGFFLEAPFVHVFLAVAKLKCVSVLNVRKRSIWPFFVPSRHQDLHIVPRFRGSEQFVAWRKRSLSVDAINPFCVLAFLSLFPFICWEGCQCSRDALQVACPWDFLTVLYTRLINRYKGKSSYGTSKFVKFYFFVQICTYHKSSVINEDLGAIKTAIFKTMRVRVWQPAEGVAVT